MPIQDFGGDFTPKAYRSLEGPSVIEFASITSSTTGENMTVANVIAGGVSYSAIGSTEGGVEFNPGISSESRHSDQFLSRYAMDETARDEEISFGLIEGTLWNLALAMGLSSNEIENSSYFYIQPTTVQSNRQDYYRHMLIRSESPVDTSTSVSTQQVTVFLKVRTFADSWSVGAGEHTIVPVTAYPCASEAGADRVGAIFNSQGISNPTYV